MRRGRRVPLALTGMAASLAALSTVSFGHQFPLLGEPVSSLAVTHVNVIPMDAPGVVRDQTVLVEDGIIVRVGSASDVSVPQNARMIEGQGQYLLAVRTHLCINFREALSPHTN